MLRVFSFLILIVFCISCDYIYPSKKEKQPLGAIIDFTKVDVSPSFSICNELLDEAKTNCFRENMYKQMTKNLYEFSFATEEIIDETVTVVLLINNKGTVSLQVIECSDSIKNEIPDLQYYVETSIKSLPKLSPAIKRGIPVATQYKLPIRIRTE